MTLEITWDRLSRAEWETLFTEVGRTPLIQSWAYGDAKAQVEGWRPYRAVLTANGRPVALAQVLEKRVAGIGRVARLNRGPVWLVEPDAERLAEALTLVRQPWRWWRGGALFLAPELAAERADEVARLGWRRRGAPQWCSSWVDLALTPEELRKRLKADWRNSLNKGPKAGLTVSVSIGEAGPLAWLMEQYRGFMAGKGFEGTPPPVIEAMFRARPADLMVVQGHIESQTVCGVLMLRHGTAATYLVGYNGEQGRKVKANNPIMWGAMMALRDAGVRWLDLGGIDEINTPGIAVFKRGIGGEEYRLAGEFLGL